MVIFQPQYNFWLILGSKQTQIKTSVYRSSLPFRRRRNTSNLSVRTGIIKENTFRLSLTWELNFVVVVFSYFITLSLRVKDSSKGSREKELPSGEISVSPLFPTLSFQNGGGVTCLDTWFRSSYFSQQALVYQFVVVTILVPAHGSSVSLSKRRVTWRIF